MPRPRLTPLQIVVVGVVGIIGCWLLATPRYAGPDEPSHAVASAALVRGHRTSTQSDGLGFLFTVPAMVGVPDPGCYVFQPSIAAGCAGDPPNDTSQALRASTAPGYPIWGHLLPGLASFVPTARWYLYIARLLNALIPLTLVIWSLRRVVERGSTWNLTGALVGLTPIAWFSMTVVNPSAYTIAGGLGLWAALLAPRATRGDGLFVVAWLAVTLPRRDGPMWATLIMAFACVFVRTSPAEVVHRLRPWRERLPLAISLVLPQIPPFRTAGDRFGTLLMLAPLVLVGQALVMQHGRRVRIDRLTRRWAVILTCLAVVAPLALANVLRAEGPDTALTWRVVSATGDHLQQVVGNLGWLDTSAPLSAVFLWWAIIGGLALVALVSGVRTTLIAAGALMAGVVAAWSSQIAQIAITVTAWQGRYSVPFLLGVPMVLAAGIRLPADADRRAQLAVRGAVWFVWNLTFYAAMRRWGAGVDGVVYPWRWESWGSPLHPLVFIVLHALCSGLLVSCDMRPRPRVLATADILDGS